jgi:hypothetical protein
MSPKTLAIMLTAILAVAVAAVTTAMPIQPTYSQAQHCIRDPPNGDRTECATTGKNPSLRFCVKSACVDDPTTHKEAGQTIGIQHQSCAQGSGECTVNKP